MAKKASWGKWLSVALGAVLFSSLNLCGIENAVSSYRSVRFSHSETHADAHPACPHSKGDQNEDSSKKESEDALCCTDLVAVKDTSNLSFGVDFLKDPVSYSSSPERFFPSAYTRSQYEVEFPPGASPPTVFLLTHFNHAPPVSF
ncbi:MAG: hypothetical protein ACRENF_05830 [Thermodesulfobacteriota bacterium]